MLCLNQTLLIIVNNQNFVIPICPFVLMTYNDSKLKVCLCKIEKAHGRYGDRPRGFHDLSIDTAVSPGTYLGRLK